MSNRVARTNFLLVPVLLAWIASSFDTQAGDNSDAIEPTKRAVIAHYAVLMEAGYHDAWLAARDLQQAIEHLLAAPGTNTLAAARQAWIAARLPYLQTEVGRFADGPIEAVEPRLNAWPIDEYYIDYVDGDPSAGVINQPDRHPTIDRELLVRLNEQEGEKNISTGFHALEFLLWGQDLNEHGPGDRPCADFVPGTGAHIGRRREYLRQAVDLLVADLQTVVHAWAPERTDTYRARLLAMPPDEALAAMIKGMGTLSGPEIAGERLTVPYETKEQEDEHSCFSDTTHLDFIYGLTGVQNLYLGRYTRLDGQRLDGPGLRELVQAVDPVLAKRLEDELAASIEAAGAIPVPFDRAIQGTDEAPGRLAVRRLIRCVEAQADSLAAAAAALSIRLKFVLP